MDLADELTIWKLSDIELPQCLLRKLFIFYSVETCPFFLSRNTLFFNVFCAKRNFVVLKVLDVIIVISNVM